MAAQTRVTSDGRERQCVECGEWWPDDREFFYTAGGDRPRALMNRCKACYLERRYKAGTRPRPKGESTVR